jgi:hypothetical protein
VKEGEERKGDMWRVISPGNETTHGMANENDRLWSLFCHAGILGEDEGHALADELDLLG